MHCDHKIMYSSLDMAARRSFPACTAALLLLVYLVYALFRAEEF